MNSRCIISVIVPVYNKEKYLNEFLQSILEQTFSQFQLILVDDASEDNSLKILLEYELRDKRIEVIALESNQGAGNARNIALNQAVGEYVIFLDADDICDKRMLEETYRTIKYYQADVCVFGIETFLDSVRTKRRKVYLSTEILFDDYPIMNEFSKKTYLFQGALTSPVHKLIRKENLGKYNTYFQNLPNANDVFFSWKVYLHSKKIIFMKEVFYYNRIGHYESITSKKKKSYFGKAVLAFYSDLKSYKLSGGEVESFVNQAIKMLYTDGYACKDIEKNDFKGMCQDAFSFACQPEVKTIIAQSAYSKDKAVLLNKILNFNYEEPYARILVRENYDFLLKLLNSLRGTYNLIALWGYGNYGKEILGALKGSGKIDYVIDNDEALWGKCAEGVPVVGYQVAKKQVSLILISMPQYAEDIRTEVNGEIPLLDLIAYLENNELPVKCF